MKSRITFLFVLFLFSTSSGDETFSATAEKTTISIGEQGVVIATLISNKNLGALNPPQVNSTDAFTVLNSSRQGPSTFSSIEIINGVTKQRNEVHYQFVYIITPKKSGAFAFPSLSINVDGREIKTNSISFNATDEAVKNSDVKVILSMNRHALYIGEQTTMSFKVAQRAHSSVDVRNGFSSALEKIEKSFGKSFSLNRLFTNQVSTSTERIGGEMYNVYSLPFIVFALNQGTYSIQSVPFEYQELRKSQRRRTDPFMDDFFDSDFFGGGVQAVPKTAFSNSLSIQVKPLPPAPADFTGSVGKFSITSSLEPNHIDAGEAATIKITVKGNTRPAGIGDVNFPKIEDCESFTPEKQTVCDTTATGFNSRKTYKYMIIPKQKGTVSIPSIKYTYFDPETGNYKTTSTEAMVLTVTEGKGNIKQPTRYISQEDIQQIGSDIRYIKTDVKIVNQTEAPYKEPIFFILIPIPFLIFFFSLIYKYQSAQKQKNSSRYIRQKALSNALKQVNAIRKQGSAISQAVFLGKVAQVIETYISDKFEFAATGRTLEELKEELLKCNADEKVVNDLAHFIQHLDSYRFGGLTFSESSRSSTIEKATLFLESLEKSIKKEKSMPRAVLPIALLMFSGFMFQAKSASMDSWFEQANKMYGDQNYDSAAYYYQKIINAGVNNSSVLFNLGNTYYRLKKPGLARLYYEKAARLNPGDQDLAANIRFLNSSIIDKVPEPERGFIESVLWRLHILLSLKVQLWVILSLLILISVFTSCALHSQGNKRLWLVYLSVLMLLITGVIGISAGIKINESENISFAIVLSPTIDAKNQPDGNKILFTAHEGTKFLIRKTDDNWSLVSLPNGISGWVKNSDLGKI